MFKFFSLGLFSVSTLLALAATTTKPAFAVCTTTDVNVQVAVSKDPAQQGNHVSVDRDPDCSGNNSTNTSTQVGNADTVKQSRRSQHRQVGAKTTDSAN